MTEYLHKAMRAPEERELLYERLCEGMRNCKRCGLCAARKNAVPGEGSLTSRVMFVGEGPGEQEDETGRPFVGPAGKLLSQILQAAGFKREEVYIANVVKCRPPDNRVPTIEETLRCQPWLEAQLALLRPRIIVALGNTPLRWFLHVSGGITKMRGRWFTWRGAALMPMFHPSYLLRNDSRKKGDPKDLTWGDIRRVRERCESLLRGTNDDATVR